MFPPKEINEFIGVLLLSEFIGVLLLSEINEFIGVLLLSMEVIHKSEKRGILRSFELKKMLRSLEKMRTHPP